MSQEAKTRGERLQIMLTPEELVLIDDFRFKYRMPSRASAVRELLSRGLSAEGFAVPTQGAIPQNLVLRMESEVIATGLVLPLNHVRLWHITDSPPKGHSDAR